MFKKYRITHLDDTMIEVEGRRVDAIEFERHFKIPSSQFFNQDGIFTEHIFFLGWCAEKREKPDLPGFDEWMNDISDVEIVIGEDSPPTVPSSSPSL